MLRRLVPSVLSLALAWNGPLLADSGPATPPPLESRVGKTITVVETNRPQDRAVIMQVWRLPDGKPAMQAHSLTTGEPLTIVEDEKAATATERFRVFRWKVNGTPPEGCPIPPAAPVVKTAAKPQVVQTAMQQTQVPQQKAQMPQQMPSTLAARQQGMTSAYVPSTSAYTRGGSSQPVQPVMQAQMQVPVNTGGSAYVRTSAQETPPPRPMEPAPIQPPNGTPAAPQTGAAPAAPPVMRTADGRQIINVTEAGRPPRQCVILGHVTQPDGTRGTRVQALDNGEIMFLVGCCLEGQCAPVCAPAPVKPSLPKLFSKPAPCPPAVVMQQPEPPKPVVIQKVEPPKVEVKPEPPKVVELKPEPPKVVTPPAPVVEAPKAPEVAVCPPVTVEKPLQVPVPLVPLGTADARPNVPPPQPPMSPYQTQASPAWKAFEADCMPEMPTGYQGCGVPSVSYGDPLVNCCPPGDKASAANWGTGPFHPVTQMPVIMGVEKVYADPQAEAVKRTVYLMTVVKTSSHPENRIWAADRLKVVNDVHIKPYVVDTLIHVAKSDPMPMVRIAAMAALTDMGAHTPAVVSILEDGMKDRDPRIRDCSETCLKQFGYDLDKKDKGNNVRTVSEVRPQ